MLYGTLMRLACCANLREERHGLVVVVFQGTSLYIAFSPGPCLGERMGDVGEGEEAA